MVVAVYLRVYPPKILSCHFPITGSILRALSLKYPEFNKYIIRVLRIHRDPSDLQQSRSWLSIRKLSSKNVVYFTSKTPRNSRAMSRASHTTHKEAGFLCRDSSLALVALARAGHPCQCKRLMKLVRNFGKENSALRRLRTSGS